MWLYETAQEQVVCKQKEQETVDSEVDVITLALEESGLSSINCSDNEMSSSNDSSGNVAVTITNQSPDPSFSSLSSPTSPNSLVTEDIVQPKKSYSSLWANISAKQKEELQYADVSLQEVEERFCLRPNKQVQKSTDRIPSKVCFTECFRSYL